jgi:hypothetical protein
MLNLIRNKSSLKSSVICLLIIIVIFSAIISIAPTKVKAFTSSNCDKAFEYGGFSHYYNFMCRVDIMWELWFLGRSDL